MEKLQLKDFLSYNYISNITLSQDNAKLAFVVHNADYNNNGYSSNIWVMDTKTKGYSRLTALNKESNFIWLDETNILFQSMRNEALKSRISEGETWTVYYNIYINGGEAQEYMRIPMPVLNIKSIDKDTFVLVAKYDPNRINLNNLKGEARTDAISKIKDSKGYEIIDEIPFWFNGGGFTNKKRNRLYLYKRSTQELTPLCDEFTSVSDFQIKDGKILYIANRFTDKFELINSVSCYDIEKCENSVVFAQEEKYNISAAEFMGEKIMIVANDMKKYGFLQNNNFYFVQDGKLELLAEHNYGWGNSIGSDCRYGKVKSKKMVGDDFYFVTTAGKSSFIHKLNPSGEITTISEDNGSVDCFDTDGTNFYFVGLRGQKLQEIYEINQQEVQLTTINEEILKNKSIVTPKYIPFINNDGIEIDGYILEPVDYDPNKEYPAILDIHGGPKTAYGTVFYHEMQLWANMGYFVFYCNPRGSDGKDNEFANLRGKYGTIDFDDFMAFTDSVLEKYPQIDVNRVGVTGGSYGGFMTNWIIGHTNRYKCAVTQRSISNFIGKFGTTDIGYYFNADQNQSTPWDNHDKLWWHSPLKYADKATTPTLFIHSDKDYRCWTPEAFQMFTALKYHGIEARLCLIKGENHELSRSGRPKARVKRLEEITQWFEKFLKN
ncbi:peptidase S9 [Candidatus Epulonipiscium fishelsonii]|uniref:Peptidase S9 n=1 Tax=Candidatus Epulonipiscium fishelsonii TaxID=77094 RepID=A0ACC8XCZ2_9FIRM|nr:peptidase S9 [Epulopiscium sp. SCG-B11WGA-EpuloA1]ONI41842.1 peptidase S9 [Epulopiscium sp. SCG-B05WGA-EpuloA1]